MRAPNAMRPGHRSPSPDVSKLARIAVMTSLALAASVTVAGCSRRSSAQSEGEADPVFGVRIPPGYRDWRLISVAREEGDLDDIRAVLGNDTAIEAYRAGKPVYPDGTIIARIAWSYLPSEENNRVFGRPQSFVAGQPKNGVQFMIKDAKRYASTGGWAFAQFDDGKPADKAVQNSCFPCHQALQGRDLVFTRYTP